MVDWIHSNLHIDVIKYSTDSQIHTFYNVIQVTNELMKQTVSQLTIHNIPLLRRPNYWYVEYCFTSLRCEGNRIDRSS